MHLKRRLLLAWGRMHIGEVIRRRALHRALREHAGAVLRPRAGGAPRVLDAGCGRGDNALWVAKRWPHVRVDAVDIDASLVGTVRERSSAVEARVADIEQFEAPHAYATMYSVDVFEHLRDPAGALARLSRTLEPGGVIILHIPRAHQHRTFRRFAHYDQDDHERDGFEPEELDALAREAGLTRVAMRHTFGPLGAFAWELFHLAAGVGRWCALLTYPLPWILAQLDGCITWKRGNGVLVVLAHRV